MSIVNKPIQDHNSESYSPKDKPDILNHAENARPDFKVYKNIIYKFEYVSLPESFKFVGLANAGLNPFENIGIFVDKYKATLPNKVEEDTGVGMFTNLIDDHFDYYFGHQVTTLNEIPDGLVGIDTHTKNFCVMTVCANSMYELVGDENGPGDAMETAGEYTMNVWLPKHRDIAITDENGECGKVIVNGKIYHTGNFEVYKKTMNNETPEMSFYIPLKG